MVFKKKKLSGIDTDTTFVADTHGDLIVIRKHLSTLSTYIIGGKWVW